MNRAEIHYGNITHVYIAPRYYIAKVTICSRIYNLQWEAVTMSIPDYIRMQALGIRAGWQ